DWKQTARCLGSHWWLGAPRPGRRTLCSFTSIRPIRVSVLMLLYSPVSTLTPRTHTGGHLVMSIRLSLSSVFACILLAGCAAAPEQESDAEVTATSQDALRFTGFEADFRDCVETIGIGLGPTAVLRPKVPA